MDFTSQVHGAIKRSNLLRADRKTINLKKSERERDSRVYVSGVWETASSWMRSWLCSPYMWGGQRVKGFGKSRRKTWLEATKTHQGKKLEQIILRNIATPLEARPTIREVLLVSWEKGNEKAHHTWEAGKVQPVILHECLTKDINLPWPCAALLRTARASVLCWGNTALPRSASVP